MWGRLTCHRPNTSCYSEAHLTDLPTRLVLQALAKALLVGERLSLCRPPPALKRKRDNGAFEGISYL